MNPGAAGPVQAAMSENTQPHGRVETIDEFEYYPFGVPTEIQVPLPRQTDAEARDQHRDFDLRMGALAEKRIIANGGRDREGDIVIRHGVPHPAYRGPDLPWYCEYPSLS